MIPFYSYIERIVTCSWEKHISVRSMSLSDRIKGLILGECQPRACRRSLPRVYLLSMLQLCFFAFLLATLPGGISAYIGPDASLPIVNKVIAPDGFSRV